MSDFHKLSTNISKGKLPGEYWNQFYVEYKGGTNRLAGTQFALNLVSIMMDDHLWQEEELAKPGEKFLELVRKCADNNFDISVLENDFSVFRKEMKNFMECLVAYNDCYMIYQYVLNILKYRFEDYDYDDYNDEEFAKELINYIISDKDQSNIRYKTMDVLKSLPIRMTKNRFFEMIKDGYSVYKGGTTESIQGFDYMLRGATLLSAPEGMDVNFPELYEYSEHFKSLDLEAIDAESYYNEKMTLMECIDYLNSHISSCQLLAEGINQLYAFTLTADAVSDVDNYEHVKKIIIAMANIGVPVDGFEPDEQLEIALAMLEGVQEEEMENLMEADGSMEDILSSTFAMQAGEAVQAEFVLCDKLRLLISSSYFADLDPEEEPVEVTEEYMASLYNAFKEDMTEKLTGISKIMSRALMSSCIGCLPMNFGNTDELHTYIFNSLSACTNLAEKMALVEQLESLMNSDMDWDFSGDEI